MYRNILVALDGSECSQRALGEAIRIGARARVCVVFVIDVAALSSYPARYRVSVREEGTRALEIAYARHRFVPTRHAEFSVDVFQMPFHGFGLDGNQMAALKHKNMHIVTGRTGGRCGNGSQCDIDPHLFLRNLDRKHGLDQGLTHTGVFESHHS